MEQINLAVSDAVRRYAFENRLSLSAFARTFNMRCSTLYAKISGKNPWTLSEADDLARMGVDVPALGTTEGVEQ